MGRSGFRRAILWAVATLTAGAPVLRADPPGSRPADTEKLVGVWLPDAADSDGASQIGRIWSSRFTVGGNTFAVSKLMDNPKDLTGTFTLDPTADPKSIDLKVSELDFAQVGTPVKIPAVTLPGIYKLAGDRLTVCFHLDPDLKRPAGFTPNGKKAVVLTLRRSSAGFKGYPAEVAVTVRDPDGKPAVGATVFGFMGHTDRKWRWAIPAHWEYYDPRRTGPDGVVKLKYADLGGRPVSAHRADLGLVGFAPVSPYGLRDGAVSVTLQPSCRVTGAIVCDELTKAGHQLGWTNAYLELGGARVASCDSTAGKFEFLVPPGAYTVHAYGSDVRGKTVPLTIPAGPGEYAAPPIALAASELVLLKGKPAPELDGIVGWKGEKVSLASLKGQYVLLEFWGYWCGPCVGSMPELLDLHETLHGKGISIIGVHLDMDGEVDSATKLDEKLVDIRKRLWRGRDLPFPVALASGKIIDDGSGETRRGGPAKQYGILGYPTTVLIDRDGKVVGQFAARSAKDAVKQIEKLLAEKK